MSNYNHSYSSPNNSSFSFTSQYSSTPSNTRFQRPRFAYAGPPSYPRPRSSASKPNPDPYLDDLPGPEYDTLNKFKDYPENVRDYSHGVSDSMRNNYGDSTLGDPLSLNSTRNTYGDSHLSSGSSSYFTGNESFYQSPLRSGYSDYNTSSLTTKGSLLNFPSENRSLSTNFPSTTGGQSFPLSVGLISGHSSTGVFATNTRGRGSEFGTKRGNLRGRFQKKKSRGGGRGGGMDAPAPYGSKFRCTVCNIIFTSQVPYDMHMRGAKHAKKLKAQGALDSIQGKTTEVKEIQKPDGKKFFCALCNVVTNSSLQLQMHLEGTKHKNKLEPKEKPMDTTDKKTSQNEVLNGKSNGGITRPAPSDFDNPNPVKMAKYSCEICNVIMNSDMQLQQHLTSKKHQAKVEGKPIIKKKKPKVENEAEGTAEENKGAANANDTTPQVTNVVGVKTLSASFVPGETLE